MGESLELFSFYDGDRSAKVRWTAAELGLLVNEHRVEPGFHLKEPYLKMNALGQIPSVLFKGETFVESTAICRSLADAVVSPRLEIEKGEAGRKEFHYWMSIFTENFESRLVDAALVKMGIKGQEYYDLHADVLRRKLAVIAQELPQEGYLCGAQFTLADICAGYNLLLAVRTRLVDKNTIQPYFDRLKARPAAQKARVFDGLNQKKEP